MQNAANSGVGRWVNHVAHMMGVNTINVIRDGVDRDSLLTTPDDIVVTESELFGRKNDRLFKEMQISLGLNGVGGKSAYEIARHLSEDGTLVTYGAMARQKMEMPNYLLIYKTLTFTGFNRTLWIEKSSREKISDIYAELMAYAETHDPKVPISGVYALEAFQQALSHAARSGRGGKILFKMD
ncbi:MAG: NADPH:quinone reductase-like Zn-dependent oxidoreductase [Candidatus Marinamargulisbacteria bacterium]